MIEFVGSKEILDFAKEEGFKTIRMTFEDKNPERDREYFNVFEISEEEFKKMCNYEDENGVHIIGEEHPIWKSHWGWWRHATGCSLDSRFTPTFTGKINGNVLKLWYNDNQMYHDIGKDYTEKDCNRWVLKHSEYDNLFSYCLKMWYCSTERNVTAIAVGLAKLNNMSLTDLFKLSIAL